MNVWRFPWGNFPSVFLHAAESLVKKHPRYAAAKSGDSIAALDLILDTISLEQVERLRDFLMGKKAVLVSAHAYETTGVNAIPEILADELGRLLGLATDASIVQTNVVYHTGSDGIGRLARQPTFEGAVIQDEIYVLVDDFVGMGGTLANLRGYIEHGGGKVLAAVALTGKPRSAILRLEEDQLLELRRNHGPDLEQWWKTEFGHSFDCLTQSEARYLAKIEDTDAIRNRIAAAKQA